MQKLMHMSKMNIFPWLSNIYRWRIYLWNVSYAFRKTAHSSKQHVSVRAHAAFLSEHMTGRAALNWNYKLLYFMSFFTSPSYKACHMFRTKCIMPFLCSSSVCVLFPIDIFFRCTCIKLNINGIASYRIAYKKYTAQPLSKFFAVAFCV